MATIILYASKHGCTEKAVQKMQPLLQDQTETVNLKKNGSIALDAYDTVLVGGSVHAGKLQKQIKNFIEKNENVLLNKRLGIFVCCMHTGRKAEEQFNALFPKNLRTHSRALGIFGGAFDFSKMNFLEKAVIKKIAGVSHSVSNLDENSIRDFAAKINSPD